MKVLTGEGYERNTIVVEDAWRVEIRLASGMRIALVDQLDCVTVVSLNDQSLRFRALNERTLGNKTYSLSDRSEE